jgi:hypothetical protein
MKCPRPTYLLPMLLLPLLALTWFTTAATARAAPAATVMKVSARDLIATATFDSTSGCLDTSVVITGSEFHTNVGTDFEADVFISQFDTCTGMLTMLVCCGFSQNPDFQISQSFDASLNATFPVGDIVSNRVFNVSLNLKWTATSHLGTQVLNTNFNTPEFTFSSHSEGNLWNATASGTVTDGTTNFTPSPASLAETMKGNFILVAVTRS